MKKVVLHTWIEEEQKEKVKLLSKNTRVPEAVYYREGIDLILDKYRTHINSNIQG